MFSNFRKYFISGLIFLLPTILTVYLFVLIIKFADGILGKYLQPYFYERFGFYFWGLSIIVAVTIVIFIGFFLTNFFGKKLYELFERIMAKLPFFKQVYPALKEMALFLFSGERLKSFKQAVLVEYPRKGIYSFGFLTNDSSAKINELVKEDLCNVFISSSPSPLTGFTILVPKKEIKFTHVSIEAAFKFIVSGGVVNPD